MGRGQRQRAEGDARDTINTQVVPILFVPGVMGSRLDISGTIADWDPDDKVEMADWGVGGLPVAEYRRQMGAKLSK